nr:DnaJ C-terminal domain-containing protein [Psychrobacter sp. JCM 18900]
MMLCSIIRSQVKVDQVGLVAVGKLVRVKVGFAGKISKISLVTVRPLVMVVFASMTFFSAFGRGARGSAGGQTGGRSQSSGFDQFGGGFGTQDSKGQDQHAEITVDLSSVYSGDDYSIKLNVPVRQPNGNVDYDNKTLKIKIPKGITDGKQIRLAGQGAAGSSNGKNGDLFLKVKIRHDANIRIEGADVYQTVNIAPWEAALGEKNQCQYASGHAWCDYS